MKILLIMLVMFSSNLRAEVEEESEALRALRLSCVKHKVALGCYNYANLLLSQKKENSESMFKLGCELGHQDSCSKKTWESITTSPVESAPAVEETPSIVTETNEPAESSTTVTAEAEPAAVTEESHSPASEEGAPPVEESVQAEAAKIDEPAIEETELDLSAIE